MQVPPPLHAALKAATGSEVGPVRVVLATLVQSTWNFQYVSALVPNSMRVPAAPAGGAVAPPKSAARSPPNAVPCVKHCCDAAAPVIILARSRAQNFGP